MKRSILTEKNCIDNIKNYHSKFVVNKVIRNLKSNKELLMSSDDSYLKNFCEEYCVQLQQEESIYFDSYVETIKSIIDSEISKLPIEIQELLEFTENEDYDSDDEINNPKFYYFREKAIEFILNLLDSNAINFENRNISKYLDSEFDEVY